MEKLWAHLGQSSCSCSIDKAGLGEMQCETVTGDFGLENTCSTKRHFGAGEGGT